MSKVTCITIVLSASVLFASQDHLASTVAKKPATPDFSLFGLALACDFATMSAKDASNVWHRLNWSGMNFCRVEDSSGVRLYVLKSDLSAAMKIVVAVSPTAIQPKSARASITSTRAMRRQGIFFEMRDATGQMTEEVIKQFFHFKIYPLVDSTLLNITKWHLELKDFARAERALTAPRWIDVPFPPQLLVKIPLPMKDAARK